jgi:hypothetical protein
MISLLVIVAGDECELGAESRDGDGDQSGNDSVLDGGASSRRKRVMELIMMKPFEKC